MYSTPVIATFDGGADWSNQAAKDNGVDLRGVACVTAYSCWAVGGTSVGGVIVHTVSGGVSDPTVTGVSPMVGPAGGGMKVTITGTGFDLGVTGVSFGSAVATNIAVESDSQLTATLPPTSIALPPESAHAVDVVVTNALGSSPANFKDQFVYSTVNN
jgi:hypothetical protein